MPVDPQLQPLLDLLAASEAPPITEMDPPAARAMMANLTRMARIVDVGATEDRVVPGPDGDLAVRVYQPPGEGAFPLLLWFHGGGWVLGSVDDTDPVARALCAGA